MGHKAGPYLSYDSIALCASNSMPLFCETIYNFARAEYYERKYDGVYMLNY